MTARELGEFTGMSPKMLQHLWDGYFGTMGAYAREAADIVVRAAGDNPPAAKRQPEQYPIVRSIYRGDMKKRTQYETDFYKRLKEVRQIYADMQNARKKQDLAEYKEIREEGQDKLKYRKTMDRVSKSFSQLREKRDRILRSEDLSSTEKYQQSQDIQVKINKLAKRIENMTREAFAD